MTQQMCFIKSIQLCFDMMESCCLNIGIKTILLHNISLYLEQITLLFLFVLLCSICSSTESHTKHKQTN